MEYEKNLNEFNREFADAILSVFPSGVSALQSGDGTLLFRGPILFSGNQTFIGTHVTLSLDKEIKAVLSVASHSERQLMTEILINNLGDQIRAQYSPSQIGRVSLNIVGTMSILR